MTTAMTCFLLVGFGVAFADQQVTFQDPNLTDAWIQVQPPPYRGDSGLLTVSLTKGPNAYFKIDLVVAGQDASAKHPNDIAAVMIDTNAVFDPNAHYNVSLNSLDYSETSNSLGVGEQFWGPALRQNGKIYVVPGLATFLYSTNSKNNISSADLVELRSDGSWLDPSSRPDFSANGSKIEFGFWRASENTGGGNCGYMCTPGDLRTSFAITDWKIVLNFGAPPPSSGMLPAPAPDNPGDIPIDPVAGATGEYYELTRELSLGGLLRFEFARYYAAFLRINGIASALGNNWMHNFDASLTTDGQNVLVTLFRGKRVSFSKDSAGAWQLSSTEQYPYQMIGDTTSYRLLDPSRNLIYSFDSTGVLTRIEDRNGNALTVTRSATSPGPDLVTDGLGRSLSFTYSGTKLMKVQDQTGRAVVFSYTGDDLTAVTGTNGKTTHYSYVALLGMPSLLLSKTMPAGNSLVAQTFDSKGRVVRQADGLGNTATLAFDTPSPGTTTVTTPIGAALKYSYQGMGDLVSVVDASGQLTSFAYDSSNRLVEKTDRIGAKRAISYDPVSGKIAADTDALGNVTQYSYTPQTQSGFTFYNLTRITYPDQTITGITYDNSGNVTATTDRNGKTRRYTLNMRGQLVTTTDPAGGITTYTYNQDGTLASIQVPSQSTLAFAYDDKQRLSKITLPDQTTRTYVYDAAGNVLTQTNEAGGLYSFTYDDNNRRTSIAAPQGGSATLGYDANDRISSYAVRGIATQSLNYDPAGRLTSILTPTGEKVTLGFDPQTRLTSVAYCSGKGPTFGYDAEGHITSVADGAARKWILTNDRAGNVMQITSPIGRQFSYSYDQNGRLSAFVDALGRATTFQRNPNGRLLSRAGPGGLQSMQTRNSLDLPVSLMDPNGNMWKWTYDVAGQRTSTIDPLGRTVSYEHSTRGRTNKISFSEGSAQLAYDGVGNVTRRLYTDGTDLNFTYDVRSHPVQGASFSLSYSNLGKMAGSNGITITRGDGFHISTITYAPGKGVTYTYDCNGLLTSIKDWAGGVTTLAYDDARELVSIQRPNGIATQYTYDSDGRLASIVEQGSKMLSSITLTRDASGNPVSEDRQVPLSADPVGGVISLSYDAAGQVTGGNYDGLGRPLRLNGRTYTWDLAGRLTGYAGSDGSASLAYDAYGTRISRASGNISQEFVINYALPLPAISIVQQNKADLRYYICLPDGTLLYSLEAANNSRRFFHFDETGSTLFLTGDDGSVADAYAYTPYGEQVRHTGASDNPFTFLGAYGVMQEGSTGLYCMDFRYYDSATARFLTRAPSVEPSLRDPNPYQYARSNPLAFIDPLGRGPATGRGSNLGEGGDFARLVLSLPEMFWPRERSNTTRIPPALTRALLDFSRGAELRRETKP